MLFDVCTSRPTLAITRYVSDIIGDDLSDIDSELFSDGGGIRGLSELFLVKEMMCRLREKKGPHAEIPRPCDVFDMIAGSGTGGYVVRPFALDLAFSHSPGFVMQDQRDSSRAPSYAHR